MAGAAGFTFGVVAGLPELLASKSAQAQAAKPVTVNPYVTLYTDGTVAIMSPAAEMGQGSLTSLPRIVADEMDADWSKVKIVPAQPSGKLYGNPLFGGLQYTAGSATVTGYFNSLRQFAAQVRYVLMDNAARRWDVPITELVHAAGRGPASEVRPAAYLRRDRGVREGTGEGAARSRSSRCRRRSSA